MQATERVVLPLQEAPPFEGGGESQARLSVMNPDPQVTLQPDTASQGPKPPLIADTVENVVYFQMWNIAGLQSFSIVDEQKETIRSRPNSPGKWER